MTTANTITISRPDEAAMTRTAAAAMAMVESFEVNDATTFELAAEELQAIKKRATALDEQRKTITKPLDEAKAATMALFKPAIEVLTKAEGILKSKMLAWQQDEARKAAEARAEAERLAQAERDRIAAEAEKLEAEGKAGEAAVQRTVAEMIVAAPQVAVAEPPKVAGVSTRTSVDFEVIDLHALVCQVAKQPELISLLSIDSTKLRAYVRGLGMATKLDGVRVFEKATLSASRK